MSSKGRNKSTKREECFRLFSAGKSITQISKETGINPKQLSRWKRQDAWVSRLEQQQPPAAEETSLEDLIRRKILDALRQSDMKPSRFKEIIDLLKLNHLVKDKRSSPPATEETEYSRLTDQELDQEIERLQRFITSKPKAPPAGMEPDSNSEAEPAKEDEHNINDSVWWNS